MTLAAQRLGFGLSLLFHLSLVAGVWLWQQRPPADSALPGEVVPVQLAMFAERPPAPQPATAAPSMPAEPPVEERIVTPPEPPAEQVVTEEAPPPAVKPGPRPRPPAKPRPTPEAASASSPAEPPPVAAVPEAVPADVVPAAAPRMAQQVQLRAAYKAALLAVIERHKFYPNRARRRRIEGEVRVAFRILADGSLADIRLYGSSGSQVLDEAALSALRRVAGVQPLPEALGMQAWDLVVPLEYQLR